MALQRAYNAKFHKNRNLLAVFERPRFKDDMAMSCNSFLEAAEFEFIDNVSARMNVK